MYAYIVVNILKSVQHAQPSGECKLKLLSPRSELLLSKESVKKPCYPVCGERGTLIQSWWEYNLESTMDISVENSQKTQNYIFTMLEIVNSLDICQQINE